MGRGAAQGRKLTVRDSCLRGPGEQHKPGMRTGDQGSARWIGAAAFVTPSDPPQRESAGRTHADRWAVVTKPHEEAAASAGR